MVHERFSPQEQRGLTAGGSAHVAASLIAGRKIGAGETQDERADRQEYEVEEYARKKSIWYENTQQYLQYLYGEPINAGNESFVYDNGKTVVKTSNISQYRDLQDALDSITLNNTYFPEANCKVLGFGMDKEDNFQIITEQPYITEGSRKATQEEIDNYLKNIGFEKSTKYNLDGRFRTGDVLLNDITPKNVILTPEGNIILIDTIMHINTPIWEDGGKRIMKEEINFQAKDNNYGKKSKEQILRSLAGEQPEGESVYRTLRALNGRRGFSATDETGRTSWNKKRFLESLQSTAKEHGTWIENVQPLAIRSLSQGFENQVYLHKDGKSVLKVNNLGLLDENSDGFYTRDFGNFLNRILAHNEFAASVPYEIVGFSKNTNGAVGVVLKQPYVKAAVYPALADIFLYLKCTGFTPMVLENGARGFSNNIFEISDTKPANILQDEDGSLHFIDLDINRVSGAGFHAEAAPETDF